jgi:hypothetical protein
VPAGWDLPTPAGSPGRRPLRARPHAVWPPVCPGITNAPALAAAAGRSRADAETPRSAARSWNTGGGTETLTRALPFGSTAPFEGVWGHEWGHVRGRDPPAGAPSRLAERQTRCWVDERDGTQSGVEAAHPSGACSRSR